MSRTEIVLAVVRCGDQICLARRSQAVATGRGLWSWEHDEVQWVQFRFTVVADAAEQQKDPRSS